MGEFLCLSDQMAVKLGEFVAFMLDVIPFWPQ